MIGLDGFRQFGWRRFAALTWTALVAVFAGCDTDAGRPSGHVSISDVDLGTIGAYDDHELVLQVENGTDHEVRVDRATAGCSCLDVVDAGGVIRSGAIGRVLCRFASGSASGSFKKRVSVFLQGTEAPIDTVIQGRSVIEVVPDPPVVDLGRVMRGAERPRALRLRRQEGASATAKAIAPGGDVVQLIGGCELLGGAGCGITVATGAPLGRFSQRVEISIEGSSQRRVVVPVVGEVVCARLDPDELADFGVVRERGEVLRLARNITTGPQDELRIGQVAVTEEARVALTVHCTRTGETSATLELALDTKLVRKGYFRTAVTVEVRAGTIDTVIRVPVQAFILAES